MWGDSLNSLIYQQRPASTGSNRCSTVWTSGINVVSSRGIQLLSRVTSAWAAVSWLFTHQTLHLPTVSAWQVLSCFRPHCKHSVSEICRPHVWKHQQSDHYPSDSPGSMCWSTSFHSIFTDIKALDKNWDQLTFWDAAEPLKYYSFCKNDCFIFSCLTFSSLRCFLTVKPWYYRQ